MNQEEKAFIIRAYDKAELAELYSPGRTAAAAPANPVSLDAEKHAATGRIERSGLQQIPPQLSEA